MQLVQELGLRGASLHTGGESFARGGRVHSAHFFELADQPVEVLIAVTTEEATRLFDRLKAGGRASLLCQDSRRVWRAGS